MTKAVSIAQQPGHAALESAANLAKATYEFMYGTAERARYTVAFAFALLAASAFMESSMNMAYCL